MGGSITVESEPGAGSTFRFTARLATSSRTDDGCAGTSGLRGRCALVVDDSATNRRLLDLMLAAWSVRSVVASSGAEALAAVSDLLARGEGIDVALLDMQMPGMDGLTLARALRAVDGLAGLPCVLLTSVGQYASREEVLAAGIGTQITKPVRHMALRHVLLDLFSDADADATRDRVAGSRPALRPARILIAEDNRVNQRVATRMLERLGFRPDAVANGLEAVAACKRVPYDLVLMDCQMPEMDGYEATRRIRAGRVRGEPVIVALTANAMKGDAERCRESGMHDYLAKPVTLPALVATLERWLAAKPAAAPVAGIDGSP
jgi:CheY-like chemotaxis protein